MGPNEVAHGEVGISLNDRDLVDGLRRAEVEVDRTMADIGRKRATFEIKAELRGFKEAYAQARAEVASLEKARADADTATERRSSAQLLRLAKLREQQASADVRASQQKLNSLAAETRAANDAYRAEQAQVRLAAQRLKASADQERADRAASARFADTEMRVLRLQRTYAQLDAQIDKMNKTRKTGEEKVLQDIEKEIAMRKLSITRRALEADNALPRGIKTKLDRADPANFLQSGYYAAADALSSARTFASGLKDRFSGGPKINLGPLTVGLGSLTVLVTTLSPLVLGLVGALGALVSVVGGGLAGAAAVGAGALGGMAIGLVAMKATLTPVLEQYKLIDQSQDAYNKAIQQYGKNSQQAAVAGAKFHNVLAQADPAARKAFTTLGKLKERWSKEVLTPAEPIIGNIFNNGVNALKKNMPTVERDTLSMFHRLQAGSKQIFGTLGGSTGRTAIGAMFGNFDKALPAIIGGANQLLTLFLRIARTGSQYFPGLAADFQQWATHLNSISNSRLDSIVHTLVEDATKLVHFISLAGATLARFFFAGNAAGVGLLDQMIAKTQKWDDNLKTSQGQKSTTNWFNTSAKLMSNLLQLIGPVAGMLASWATALEPVLTPMTQFVLGVSKAVEGFTHLTALHAPLAALGVVIGGLWLTSKIRNYTEQVQATLRWMGLMPAKVAATTTAIEAEGVAQATVTTEVEAQATAEGAAAVGAGRGAVVGAAGKAAPAEAGLLARGGRGLVQGAVRGLAAGTIVLVGTQMAGDAIGGHTGSHVSEIGKYAAAGATLGGFLGPAGAAGGAGVGAGVGAFHTLLPTHTQRDIFSGLGAAQSITSPIAAAANLIPRAFGLDLSKQIFGGDPSAAEKQIAAFSTHVQALGHNLAGLSQSKLTAIYNQAQKFANDKSFEKWWPQLRKTADAFDPVRVGLVKMGDTFKATASYAGSSMKDIQLQVKVGSVQIENTLGTGSTAAREALAHNFALAAQDVYKSMQSGVISTAAGLKEINKLMAEALRQVGINVSSKTLAGIDKVNPNAAAGLLQYANDPTVGGTQSGSEVSGAGSRPMPTGHAMGGLIQLGRDGDAGHDIIPMNVGGQPIVAAPGEKVAVFTRHQQAVMDERLSDYGGLAGMFQQENRPHYMARGGFTVSGRVSTFGPPGEPAGSTASGASSSLPGIALYDQSAPGGRGPTLGHTFRVSIGSHTANLPQTDVGPAPWTGRVIDVTGAGARAMGINPANFPTDAEGSAVLSDGSPITGGWTGPGGSAVTASVRLAKHIKRVRYRGPGGTLGAIGQAALDHVRLAANARIDKANAKAQASAAAVGGGGQSSTTGLVPQVQAALAWARSHGWTGQVTSGFRSYAEQAQLYARYLAGGNLAAPPGRSNHESGRAVDVTDIPGFKQAMASAPPSAKLLWFGPADPVHFSVDGHARGGFVKAQSGYTNATAYAASNVGGPSGSDPYSGTGVVGMPKAPRKPRKPKQPAKPVSGLNYATGKIEYHTPGQWHDIRVRYAAFKLHHKADKKVKGRNPFNNKVESHTGVEWKEIRLNYSVGQHTPAMGDPKYVRIAEGRVEALGQDPTAPGQEFDQQFQNQQRFDAIVHPNLDLQTPGGRLQDYVDRTVNERPLLVKKQAADTRALRFSQAADRALTRRLHDIYKALHPTRGHKRLPYPQQVALQKEAKSLQTRRAAIRAQIKSLGGNVTSDALDLGEFDVTTATQDATPPPTPMTSAADFMTTDEADRLSSINTAITTAQVDQNIGAERTADQQLVDFWQAEWNRAKQAGAPDAVIQDIGQQLIGARGQSQQANQPTADEQGMLDQSKAQALAGFNAATASAAALSAFTGFGDIGAGGYSSAYQATVGNRDVGGPQINIYTLHPSDPQTLSAIGAAATSGMALQGSVPNNTLVTGL